jgi:hypothetical protein
VSAFYHIALQYGNRINLNLSRSRAFYIMQSVCTFVLVTGAVNAIEVGFVTYKSRRSKSFLTGRLTGSENVCAWCR